MKADAEFIEHRFRKLQPFLDERTRRLVAASEAAVLGHGGVALVSRATKVSQRAIRAGIKELAGDPGSTALLGRIRKAGGGRRRATQANQNLEVDLESLVRGDCDPNKPLHLIWTQKSVKQLARELAEKRRELAKKEGRPAEQKSVASHQLVAELLVKLGYSLNTNLRGRPKAEPEDYDGWYRDLNAKITTFLAAGQDAVALDMTRLECKSPAESGRQWKPRRGQPTGVRVHDFIFPDLGRIYPFGVTDLDHEDAWHQDDPDRETAFLALAILRGWIDAACASQHRGQGAASDEDHKRTGGLKQAGCENQVPRWLLILTDAKALQSTMDKTLQKALGDLSRETGVRLRIALIPPGTRRWNGIANRLVSVNLRSAVDMPTVAHQISINQLGPSEEASRSDLARKEWGREWYAAYDP